jgi:hypothetical protein
MGTRSMIGLEVNNGIEAIYCHFDGYLHQVGRLLSTHYTTHESVQDLVNLGNLSSLGTSPEDSVAMYRDRKESLVCYTYDSPSQFLEAALNKHIDYTYLFTKNGIWLYSTSVSDGEWNSLNNALTQIIINRL